MFQPRRTFLYWMGMSFLALLLPRCNKAKNNSTPKLPYHHLPDGTFRNLPGAPIREQDPPAGKSSPFTFSRMLCLLMTKSNYSKRTRSLRKTGFSRFLCKEQIQINASFLVRLGKITDFKVFF